MKIYKSGRVLSLAAFVIANILLGTETLLAQYSITYPAPVIKDGEITAQRKKALLIFKRITGFSVSIDDPQIVAMEAKLLQGNAVAAAQIATQNPSFYNITVKEMATKMADREESVRAPFGDFVATIVGVVRDDIDARQMLTGNFVYQGDLTKVSLPNSSADLYVGVDQFYGMPKHYFEMKRLNFDLSKVLKRVDEQRIMDEMFSGSIRTPETAGVLSSQQFMRAHGYAGTNRRLVQYTLRSFACVDIQQVADANGPDDMVGMDVDRFPGGTNYKFQTSCKSCHTVMDGFRGAFSAFDSDIFATRHSKVISNQTGPGHANSMAQSPIGVSAKYNGNDDVYPDGFVTRDTSWVNHADRGSNADFFGWRGPASGTGAQSFGALVSNSRRFSTCMVQKVFNSVCKRNPVIEEKNLVSGLSDDFEKNGYRLRSLFESVASRTECLGN